MKRNILIIGSAVLITVALMMVIYNLYQDMEKAVAEMFNRQQMLMARHVAEMIEDYFESLKKDMKILANSHGVQYLEKEEYFRKSKGIYNSSSEPAVVDIRVLDAEGILRFSILDPGLIGKDFSQRRYFQEARKLSHGEVFTSELLTLAGGEVAGRKGFVLAITVFQNIKDEYRPDPSCKFNGVVVFLVSLERLIEKFVAPIKSGRSGYAFLLNGHGTLLYHPEHPEMVGKNIFQGNESCYGCHQSFELEEEMAQGKSGMGVYPVQIGRKKLIAFWPVRVGSEMWSIAVGAPNSEITHLVRKSSRGIFVLMGGIMAIVIGGAVLVLRINTRRIKGEEARKHLEEERRLQQEIKKSEKKYRELVEQANDGIWMVDKDNVTVFANRRICEITGCDDMVGKPTSLFLNKESQKKIAEENGKRRRGENSRYEVELTTRDGRRIPVIISDSPRFDEQGNFLGTFGIFTDISERKKNEEELKRINEELKRNEAALLNVLSDFHETNRKLQETSRELENIFESVTEYSIMTVDLEGKIIFFGKGSRNVFGWESEEILGKSITVLHKKEEAETLIPGVLKEAEQEGKSERETECIRKNGELFPVVLTVTPIRDENNKIIGYTEVANDITERKELQEQLIQAEKLRALGEMAGGVAHDFNNLLAGILGRIELLLLEVEDEELAKWLKVIKQSALDGGETIRRIQDFTRIRTDETLADVDVNQIVKDTVEITRTKWKDESEANGIKVNLITDLDEKRLPAAGNPSELREVLTNVILNALDAMPEGGKITIKTGMDPDSVYISVADTGRGMSEDTKRRVFEPFFTTKGVKGTGLGLSVAYGIVARHKGEITVESKLDKGTTFTVNLPLAGEMKPERKSAVSAVSTQPLNILVIDDEEAVRESLADILTVAGHKVSATVGGREGLAAFKKVKHDLIFTDLGMPEFSGWEVARAIKGLDPKAVVVLVTGWGVQLGETELRENGIDLLVAKPFELEQILSLVAEAMELRKSENKEIKKGRDRDPKSK